MAAETFEASVPPASSRLSPLHPPKPATGVAVASNRDTHIVGNPLHIVQFIKNLLLYLWTYILQIKPLFLSHTHDSWQIGSRVTRTNVWRSTNKHNLFDNTPSILNCRSFDFFNSKFDHSFYSKNLCKKSQIYVIFEDLSLIKQATTK